MNAFFEVSIRCSEITEEGKVKKHRKKYLLDSVSFSEAEARNHRGVKRDDSRRLLH